MRCVSYAASFSVLMLELNTNLTRSDKEPQLTAVNVETGDGHFLFVSTAVHAFSLRFMFPVYVIK